MDKHLMQIPDFSGDDFRNDKEIQKIRKEAEDYQQLVDDSIAIIDNELGIEESSHKNFKGFLMFKSLRAIIVKSFKAKALPLNLIVSIAEYRTAFPTAKNPNSGTDQYIFGCFELHKRFPKTYITKETIREKITDLFLKIETDFPDNKKFSRRFHVLTQDSKGLRDLMTFKNLDELTEFPEMEVEIQENFCLFRNSRKSISLKEANEFAQLAKTLARMLN